MTTTLTPSWTKSSDYESAWDPVPNAEEYWLVSCYVSVAGLERLEQRLSPFLERPEFKAHLLFSFAGLQPSQMEPVSRKILSLTRENRIRAYVVGDGSRNLFHVKAVGSCGPGAVRVSVGSANVTGQAMGSQNLEYMAIINQEMSVFKELRSSLLLLIAQRRVRALKEVLKNPMAAMELPKPPTTPLWSPPALPPEVAVVGEIARLDDAYTFADKFFAESLCLCRNDISALWTVSVKLASLQNDRILKDQRSRKIGAGIIRKGQNSIFSVKCLPPGLDKKVNWGRKRLGELWGRFTLDVGFGWMPKSWHSTLENHWSEICKLALPSTLEQEVRHYLEDMASQGNNPKFLKKLINTEDINPPSMWELSQRQRFQKSGQRELPDEVNNRVVAYVARMIYREIISEIEILKPNDIFRSTSAAFTKPYPGDPHVGHVTQVRILADLVHMGADSGKTSADTAQQRAPAASMKAALGQNFRAGEISPDDARAGALELRSRLSDVNHVGELLVGAIHLFRRCYGELQLNDLPAPSFRFSAPDMSKQEEDDE